ncbi:MAG TPA: arsenic resistance protein [Candidatus Agrococcus pullicola]|uniref:Arsenic resistance protein n=1 Tax=Candidatus Agrococcus pullicola TaxID=2838429 RepID=A0A9D1YTI8_9MICO|nr:arsenic resistance protein [Candidatus Agrococcus pullicola]
MLPRDVLERHQVWVYLAALAVGLFVGVASPSIGDLSDALVWPVLAALLYATFAQTPLASIPVAFKDVRFLTAALVGNFVLVPILVWAIVWFMPDDQALRLGLFLVLLVPCTDWFITFSRLGGGDSACATALTPITLLLQLLLLPLYLRLLAGIDVSSIFAPADVWPALLVVLVPLALAAGTELLAKSQPRMADGIERLGWLPVPLLAVVIFLVSASHAGVLDDIFGLLPAAGAAIAFLVASLVLAKLLALAARLPTKQARTLAFSVGTRNSFLVLPFALALPAGWEASAIVVVMQSIIELLGMLFFLWFVPRVLFR